MTDDLAPPLPPLHPGEVLREEFMVPLGLSAGAVARACRVPRTRIEHIAREEIGITGDSAVRLGRAFGIDPRFWMNLQTRYELESAERGNVGKQMERHHVLAAPLRNHTLKRDL